VWPGTVEDVYPNVHLMSAALRQVATDAVTRANKMVSLRETM